MSFETLSFYEIPEDFQKGVITDVIDLVKRGESVRLVGAPGSGNSLIAKALTQSSLIRNKYFGKHANKYILVRLDGTVILERRSLNLSRLLLSLFLNDDNLPNDEILIQNEIDKVIGNICLSKKLVIIIDHIEEINFPEFKSFYTNLNQIYRRYEPKISLIFISPYELKTENDLVNFGPLSRVILQNALITPPFNKKDAFWFIKERENQVGGVLSQEDKKMIFDLSGGFPRTIKRLLESVVRGINLKDLGENPILDLPLSIHLSELTKYLDILPDIPILKTYMGDSSFRENSMGTEFAGRLTKNEESLFKYFASRRGKLIPRDEGIEHLWGGEALDVSDHAYDQIVLRLRKKLQTSTPKMTIETVRGRGHVLKIT